MRSIAVWILALGVAGASHGAAAAPPPPDPDVVAIVSGISAERIEKSVVILTSFKTRHTLSDPLPSGDGIGAAGAWLHTEMKRISAESGGRLKISVDAFDQPPVAPVVPHPVRILNFVATLPGSDPGGVTYVLSAHYDSRARNILDANSPAPGADDDGSGIAAVLETARAMSHYNFRATVVFLAVAGAEEGFLGSAHWAEKARRGQMAIGGMLNDDIVGNTRAPDGTIDRNSVRLFAQGILPTAQPGDALLELIRTGGENDTPSRELARAIREIGAEYVPSMKVRIIYRTDRYGRGGDELSFLDRGYPAVRFVEPAEDFRRQQEDVRVEGGVAYGDTTDYVDYIYVADVARLNAAALAVLARAPAPPRSVEIETARREAGTTLRWAPNAEKDLAGYRVVWRDTTAPYWEHSRDVGRDTTRLTLPGVSKDNVDFGVEAFDSAGHASPAVFPLPRRTL